MMDVGYHFSNLWFAGQKKNWPLAQFYLDETRSHLRWAVRIIPVCKTTSGEVDLRGLLEAVDHAGLTEIGKAIAGTNSAAFETAYKQTLDGCYTCHKAAEAATPATKPQRNRICARVSPTCPKPRSLISTLSRPRPEPGSTEAMRTNEQ